MKKIPSFLVMSTLLITPALTVAAPPITCPPALEYTCVPDASCPKTRCTLTSSAASPWIFFAPIKPLNHSQERTSCSNLEPGKYNPRYLASIDGHIEHVGYAAYCMYIEIVDQFTIAMSGLSTTEYTHSKGPWQKGELSPYPSYVCSNPRACEFTPIAVKK